jgi:hypothetical protein
MILLILRHQPFDPHSCIPRETSASVMRLIPDHRTQIPTPPSLDGTPGPWPSIAFLAFIGPLS